MWQFFIYFISLTLFLVEGNLGERLNADEEVTKASFDDWKDRKEISIWGSIIASMLIVLVLGGIEYSAQLYYAGYRPMALTEALGPGALGPGTWDKLKICKNCMMNAVKKNTSGIEKTKSMIVYSNRKATSGSGKINSGSLKVTSGISKNDKSSMNTSTLKKDNSDA